MPQETPDTIIRTEEIDEILSAPPRWILRWGLSVIFILIATGLVLSYFIKYPDILTADITLTTLNPPVTLVARHNGKLTQLLAGNHASVKTGQIIAVIENTADYRDVIYLAGKAREVLEQTRISDSLPRITIRDSLRTGELTPFYLLLLKSVKDLNLYKELTPYARQISLLQKDLVNYKDLLDKYHQQGRINSEQLTLVEADYNRDQALFEGKAIAAREFENKKRDYLSALNSNEATKITLSNTLIQINAIEKNILQLQLQDYEEQTKLRSELLQNLETLLAEINTWKQLYLIESPADGRLSFFNVWSVNQEVQPGDELFSVVPNRKQEFIGKCLLPVQNSGKLEIGQQVNIKLDNYPYHENGMLSGTLVNVSEVPNNDRYAVDVKLNHGLITSYNKTLTYQEQMKGKADIITQNVSVLDRLFFNLKKMMNGH